MIKGFEAGKYYRYTGPKQRFSNWAIMPGNMDFCLDGQPYKCIRGWGVCASFEDSKSPDTVWDWSSGFEFWEEVLPKDLPAPLSGEVSRCAYVPTSTALMREGGLLRPSRIDRVRNRIGAL